MSVANKIRTFHALLYKLGLMEHKAAILAGEGVESTKELSEVQLDALITALQQRLNSVETVLKQQRSVCLNIATELGIKQPDGWEGFNVWMLKYSALHKPLNNYTLSQLNELKMQLYGLKCSGWHADRSPLRRGKSEGQGVCATDSQRVPAWGKGGEA